jgi:hypothetical protein
MQRLSQYQPPRFQVTLIRLAIQRGGFHHAARDIRKMRRHLAPIGIRRIHPSQLQRYRRDIEFRIGQIAGGFYRAAWFGGVDGGHWG